MSMGMAVMSVAAMIVMMMVVAVIMGMRVIMCMIMTGVAVLLMRMPVRRAGIGATFRIERRLDLDDARAESLHHRLDDVILPDAEGLRHDLGWQMPIAEMPSDPDQMMRIAALDLEQRLRRRDHLDQPVVFKHQRVAAAQGDGGFEVEQEFEAARAGHRHPPPVAVIEVEHDRIGGRLLPAILPENPGRADHAEILSTLASLMISITVGDAFRGADSARHVFICGALPWALRSSRVSQRSTTT